MFFTGSEHYLLQIYLNRLSDLASNLQASAGHEIAPNTVANATKIIVLATKIQTLVAKLATRTL